LSIRSSTIIDLQLHFGQSIRMQIIFQNKTFLSFIKSKKRFRPILMTAFTPIGGLLTSTLLSLIAVPWAYTLFDDMREYFKKLTALYIYKRNESQGHRVGSSGLTAEFFLRFTGRLIAGGLFYFSSVAEVASLRVAENSGEFCNFLAFDVSHP